MTEFAEALRDAAIALGLIAIVATTAYFMVYPRGPIR